MGDFIEVIGRERKDDDVAQQYATRTSTASLEPPFTAFSSSFYTAFARSTATLANDWSFQPWLLLLRLPVESLTSVEDMQRYNCLHLVPKGTL